MKVTAEFDAEGLDGNEAAVGERPKIVISTHSKAASLVDVTVRDPKDCKKLLCVTLDPRMLQRALTKFTV